MHIIRIRTNLPSPVTDVMIIVTVLEHTSVLRIKRILFILFVILCETILIISSRIFNLFKNEVRDKDFTT